MQKLKVDKKNGRLHPENIFFNTFSPEWLLSKAKHKTMTTNEIFTKLWEAYSSQNPSAGEIHHLFQEKGKRVVNDHVAFRTYDDPRVSIDVLARPFINLGYKAMKTYHFKEKKLRAIHYELPGEPEAPRVFISELILNEFSQSLQQRIRHELDRVPESLLVSPDLIFQGTLFKPVSYQVYQELRQESEYAAWVYAFGYRANHFTVSINHLDGFDDIAEVNQFLKDQGYSLNASGGEIKGSPKQLLEQSSTLADRVEVSFSDGKYVIPGCYYEFAKRYPGPDGQLFSAFIAGSADKIFESTDYRSE